MPGPALELKWKLYDAQMAEQRGDWAAAVSAYEAAADIQAALASAQSSRMLMERVLGASRDLGSQLAYAQVRANDLPGAIAALENARARLLTAKLARAAYRAATAGGRVLPETYESVLRQVEQFELIRDSPRDIAREGITISQQALSAALQRMAEDVRRIPGFEYFGLPQSAASVSRLLDKIGIAYLFSAEHGGYALVHLGAGNALVPVPLPGAAAKEVYQMASLFASAVSWLDQNFQIAMSAIDDVCHWLGSAVVTPLLPVLDRNPGLEITLVSCGWFSILPVHAAWIVDRGSLDDRRFPLIDRGVGYIPNAQVLRAVAALPPTQLAQNVLVVAEPASAHPDLPASVAEAAAVERVWPSSRRAWQKDEVLRVIPGCTLAHFASHATSRPERPLRSSIEVAGGDSIEVHELMSVPFGSAPLCVLSGCETAAVTEAVPDEGTGLVSGLLAARARGVVASMWPVDDAATNVLMTLLHQGLRKDPDAQVALSRAQSRMRRMTISELRNVAPHVLDSGDVGGPPASRPFRHPYYWSGFCYTGARDRQQP